MGMTDVLALSRLETKDPPQISVCNVIIGILLHLLRSREENQNSGCHPIFNLSCCF